MAKVRKFDTKGKGMKPFTALPAGDYRAKIIKSVEKPTKAKTGHYIELTWQVVKGEYKGKKFFSRLNLDNPNETAVEIAEDEFVTISIACGFAKTQWDTDRLHGKECIVTLSFIPAEGKNGESNDCKNYQNPKDVKGDDSGDDSKDPWGDDDKKDKSKKGKSKKGKKKGKK